MIGSEARLASDLVKRAIGRLRIVAQVCSYPAGQYADLLDAYILRIQLNLHHENPPEADYGHRHLSATRAGGPIAQPASDFQFNLDFFDTPLFGENGHPAAGIDASTVNSMDPAAFGEWASIIEHGMEGLPSLSVLFPS